MKKICTSTYQPEISGEHFLKYLQAQIIYSHLDRIVPLMTDTKDPYKLLFEATQGQERKIIADVQKHVPEILKANYRQAQLYLFNNGLYKAPECQNDLITNLTAIK